jgi:hypothetical protein
MYTGQHFSGAGMALALASFWCQQLSGVRQLLVSASFWRQPFSRLWYQGGSGVRISLVSGFLWCQDFSGVRKQPELQQFVVLQLGPQRPIPTTSYILLW